LSLIPLIPLTGDKKCQFTTCWAAAGAVPGVIRDTGWMPQPRPLPPELGPAFTYAQAIAGGASARRLRNTDVATPFRGARATFTTADAPSLARAYLPLLHPGQYFSHLTAAQLLGLRMPHNFTTNVLHVTSEFPIRAPRRLQVCGHQTRRPDVVLVDGIPVSSPVRAWIECAAYLEVDDLVVMGDTLVRRKTPFATMEELRSAVAAHDGGRGTARLMGALALMRPLTDSARETLLRLVLERAGFPEPEVNGTIENEFGQTIAHGDLVYRGYRTIVEYDGEHHRLDERQFTIDVDRLHALAEAGWRVIQVSRSLLQRRATLLGRVETALGAGGWRADGR